MKIEFVIGTLIGFFFFFFLEHQLSISVYQSLRG